MMVAVECEDKLTRANRSTVCKDRGINSLTTGLDRAVTEAISESRVGAVACGVAGGASKLRSGDGEHVVYAGLLGRHMLANVSTAAWRDGGWK